LATRAEERILLDPKVVFGADATSGFSKLDETFDRPEFFGRHRDWHKLFEIPGGTDIERLPPECPEAGTIILEFYDSGRIDRYEVTGSDRVVCHYSTEYQSVYSYKRSWQLVRVGVESEWHLTKRSSARSLSPVCRIVLIEP